MSSPSIAPTTPDADPAVAAGSRPSPWKRGVLYQLVAVLLLAAGVLMIASTTQANLQQLGVQSGLAFVSQPAGFEINQKLIAYDAGSSIGRAMLVALINTLLLCAVTIIGASAVGLCVGIGRLSRSAPMRWLAGAYVEMFRNIPVLLQVFLWYFIVLRVLPPAAQGIELFGAVQLNNRGLFLPEPRSSGMLSAGTLALAALAVAIVGVVVARSITRAVQDHSGRHVPASVIWLLWMVLCLLLARVAGLDQVEWVTPAATRFGFKGGYALMPELLALVISLSLYNAAYVAEIARSALQSIPKGQIDAAHALGLSRARAFRLVLLPAALRLIVPPLATVYQNVLKSSSLGAAIAYPEITSVLIGSVNNVVGQPVAIIGITLIVYLSLSMCIAGLMHWYERRVSRWS